MEAATVRECPMGLRKPKTKGFGPPKVMKMISRRFTMLV
jgi:hypothetical protein